MWFEVAMSPQYVWFHNTCILDSWLYFNQLGMEVEQK